MAKPFKHLRNNLIEVVTNSITSAKCNVTRLQKVPVTNQTVPETVTY